MHGPRPPNSCKCLSAHRCPRTPHPNFAQRRHRSRASKPKPVIIKMKLKRKKKQQHYGGTQCLKLLHVGRFACPSKGPVVRDKATVTAQQMAHSIRAVLILLQWNPLNEKFSPAGVHTSFIPTWESVSSWRHCFGGIYRLIVAGWREGWLILVLIAITCIYLVLYAFSKMLPQLFPHLLLAISLWGKTLDWGQWTQEGRHISFLRGKVSE